MLGKTILLFNTIKYLKPKQIYYRLYYFIRNKIRRCSSCGYPKIKYSKEIFPLKLQKSIHIVDYYLGDNEFEFLNLSKKFDKIDWNYAEYGKLWTYNLTYFDFLSQENNEENLDLIKDFISNIEHIKDGLEPFPISLRGINWIKFLSLNGIQDRAITNSLYAQYHILLNNLEYHLLGNHLLENSFSLLFGAYYFQDELLYKKAKELLEEQLTEQILDDGGHFEQSPMYHQIMLFRLLDCINLVQNSSWKNQELLEFLEQKAQIMLGWLKNISYKNGDIPLFNDSSKNIAPTTYQLLEYAKRLEIGIKNIKLSDSGYRKVVKDNYELIVDIGDIKASYIAGHTHADTFNFELRVGGKAFIVDTGLSTYETCARRDTERSTNAHNTVEVNGKNSSEVWGSFRVANRASVIDLVEKEDFISATHDGYKPILHTRRWSFDNNGVVIEDSLNIDTVAIARLYFYPDVSKEEILKHLNISSSDFEFATYQFSPKFNIKLDAIFLIIRFKRTLKIEILNFCS